MRRLVLAAGFTGALIGGLFSTSAATAAPNATPQTATWTGNGTTNGYCSNTDEGLTGVPSGGQGWLFILTSPAPGPWGLTASFVQSGTLTTGGTQEGDGSVHFLVDTSIGDRLVSATATNGTAQSVLTVSGCTANGTSTTPAPGIGGSGGNGGPVGTTGGTTPPAPGTTSSSGTMPSPGTTSVTGRPSIAVSSSGSATSGSSGAATSA
ncbi:MAG: hypothetical protein KGJ77_10855, partial [Acidobacteriota bacterium]|nr:hypothetical protein [Acidobacteriota bacterium]